MFLLNKPTFKKRKLERSKPPTRMSMYRHQHFFASTMHREVVSRLEALLYSDSMPFCSLLARFLPPCTSNAGVAMTELVVEN